MQQFCILNYLWYLWWRIGLFAVHITCVLFSSSAHMALDIKVFSSRFSSSPSDYCRQGTTTLLHCCCMRVMRLWYDDIIADKEQQRCCIVVAWGSCDCDMMTRFRIALFFRVLANRSLSNNIALMSVLLSSLLQWRKKNAAAVLHQSSYAIVIWLRNFVLFSLFCVSRNALPIQLRVVLSFLCFSQCAYYPTTSLFSLLPSRFDLVSQALTLMFEGCSLGSEGRRVPCSVSPNVRRLQSRVRRTPSSLQCQEEAVLLSSLQCQELRRGVIRRGGISERLHGGGGVNNGAFVNAGFLKTFAVSSLGETRGREEERGGVGAAVAMDSVEESKDSRHTGKWKFLVEVSLSC